MQKYAHINFNSLLITLTLCQSIVKGAEFSDRLNLTLAPDCFDLSGTKVQNRNRFKENPKTKTIENFGKILAAFVNFLANMLEQVPIRSSTSCLCTLVSKVHTVLYGTWASLP